MPDSSYAVSEQNSRGRQYPVAPTRDRSSFQRDYTRLVHSHAFRRLQGKTQVFPAEWFFPSPAALLHPDYRSVPGHAQALAMRPSDTHRTRMSHSIEVEQISRSLARALGLNADLAGTLAVGHDIGHPPFGHTGQDALNKLFASVGGFEHNHHALRLVDTLESPYPEHPGLNLMFETREGLLKHCSLERAKLLGPVAARHLTGESPPLEVQAVDVADQIAYLFGDLEDAVDRFVLTPDQLLAQYWFRDAWEKVQPGIPVPNLTDLVDPLRSPMARARLGSVWRILLADSVNDVIASSRARLELLDVHSLADVRRHDTLVDLSAERRQIHKDIRAFSRAQIYSNAALLDYRSFSVEALAALHENVTANPTHWGFSPAPRPEKVRDWLASLTDRTVLRWYVDHRPGLSVASSFQDAAAPPDPAPPVLPEKTTDVRPTARPPRVHRSARRPHP